MKLLEIRSPPHAPWMYKTRDEVVKWVEKVLDPMGILSYVDFRDLTIESSGGPIRLYKKHLKKLKGVGNVLPAQFAKHQGAFFAFDLDLTSFKGLPKIVTGIFSCNECDKLTSLDGSPIKVGYSFFCSGTNITSLEGCPKDVYHEFYCGRTPIVSLENIHRHVQRIGGSLYVSHNVNSHILGILKIRDLKSVFVEFTQANKSLNKALRIINKYLKDKPNPMQRDIHGCQIELIEAKIPEFAQL